MYVSISRKLLLAFAFYIIFPARSIRLAPTCKSTLQEHTRGYFVPSIHVLCTFRVTFYTGFMGSACWSRKHRQLPILCLLAPAFQPNLAGCSYRCFRQVFAFATHGYFCSKGYRIRLSAYLFFIPFFGLMASRYRRDDAFTVAPTGQDLASIR